MTTHISTDIAAVPLLWVIPLALYLATFVLVFARRTILPHRWMVRLQPFLVVPVAGWFYLSGTDDRRRVPAPAHHQHRRADAPHAAVRRPPARRAGLDEAGRICWIQQDTHLTDAQRQEGKFSSCWVVMSRRAKNLGRLPDDPPLAAGARRWPRARVDRRFLRYLERDDVVSGKRGTGTVAATSTPCAEPI